MNNGINDILSYIIYYYTFTIKNNNDRNNKYIKNKSDLSFRYAMQMLRILFWKISNCPIALNPGLTMKLLDLLALPSWTCARWDLLVVSCCCRGDNVWAGVAALFVQAPMSEEASLPENVAFKLWEYHCSPYSHSTSSLHLVHHVIASCGFRILTSSICDRKM